MLSPNTHEARMRHSYESCHFESAFAENQTWNHVSRKTYFWNHDYREPLELPVCLRRGTLGPHLARGTFTLSPHALMGYLPHSGSVAHGLGFVPRLAFTETEGVHFLKASVPIFKSLHCRRCEVTYSPIWYCSTTVQCCTW